MPFLILKFVMFALAYKLYLVKKEPFFSALLFSIPLAIAGLFMGHPALNVFVGSAILFALGFVCFWFLHKVPNASIAHYSIIVVMLLMIVFVI